MSSLSPCEPGGVRRQTDGCRRFRRGGGHRGGPHPLVGSSRPRRGGQRIGPVWVGERSTIPAPTGTSSRSGGHCQGRSAAQCEALTDRADNDPGMSGRSRRCLPLRQVQWLDTTSGGKGHLSRHHCDSGAPSAIRVRAVQSRAGNAGGEKRAWPGFQGQEGRSPRTAVARCSCR